jgi:hypothetical protein
MAAIWPWIVNTIVTKQTWGALFTIPSQAMVAALDDFVGNTTQALKDREVITYLGPGHRNWPRLKTAAGYSPFWLGRNRVLEGVVS